jgi:hypothetical protein
VFTNTLDALVTGLAVRRITPSNIQIEMFSSLWIETMAAAAPAAVKKVKIFTQDPKWVTLKTIFRRILYKRRATTHLWNRPKR